MKKPTLLAIAFISIIALSFVFGAAHCYAETLDEAINNLIAKRQSYDTYLTSAYFNNNKIETDVSTQSGKFSFRQTDYSLPGRNGLDLEITRLYKSGDISAWENSVAINNGVLVNIVHSYWQDEPFWSFYEERYNLGAGMRFSFPSIEAVIGKDSPQAKYLYLHSESGAVYRMIGPKIVNGEKTYSLEGYKLDDIRIIEDSATNPAYNYTTNTNGNGNVINKSKYILIDRDGTRTFFSDKDTASATPEKYEGRILAIVDRYGNEIKFDYSNFSYTAKRPDNNANLTRTRKLISKIRDSVGRIVTIDYLMDSNFAVSVVNGVADSDLQGKFNIKITTPDNQMIVYEKTSFLYNSGIDNRTLRERLQYSFKLESAATYTNKSTWIVQYKYWYEQSDCCFDYSGTNYQKFQNTYGALQYNKWENISFIQYPSYKAKSLKYDYGVRRLGTNGTIKYRKVSEEADILLDNSIYTLDQNNNLQFSGTSVRKQSYAYDGEPDGYAPGNKVYPKIDFEDKDAMNNFIFNDYWTRSTSAASDGEYGIISASDINTAKSMISLRVTLDKQGMLSFEYKKNGQGAISIRAVRDINISVSEQVTEMGSGWCLYECFLPKGGYFIDIIAEKQGNSNAQICIDNISIGKSYGSTVTDALSQKGIKTNYLYNSRHSLYRVYGYGDNHFTAESRVYDFRNMPKRKQTVQYILNPVLAKETPEYTEERYAYDNYGNLLTYSDSMNPDISYNYAYYGADKFHKLKTRTTKNNSNTLSETLYTVDSSGNTTREAKSYTEYTVNKSVITDFAYNRWNMVSKSTYASGDSANAFTTKYEYGVIGNSSANMLYLTRVYSGDSANPITDIRYQYNFNNGLITSKNEYNNAGKDLLATYYEYDYLSRLVNIRYPDYSYQKYKYFDYGDAYGDSHGARNFAINIFGQNAGIVYAYDIFGNLLSTRQYNQTTLLSSYQYDSQGNIINETDAKGNCVKYAFDSASRLAKKEYYNASGIKQREMAYSFIDRNRMGYSVIGDFVKAETCLDEMYILKRDGTVWKGSGYKDIAGDMALTQMPGLSGITDISAGLVHVLALKDNGSVYAWGYNNAGQLGNNSNERSFVPVLVTGLNNATKISAGDMHSLAVKADKTVWAWGDNANGQLGNNSTINSKLPVQVINLANVKEISAGYVNSYAIKEDGTAWAWGNNNVGQLGVPIAAPYDKTTPVQMVGMNSASKIAAAFYSVAILANDRTVYTAGGNDAGQLGTGSPDYCHSTLTRIPNLNNVSQIASRSKTYYAVMSNGRVSVWGEHARIDNQRPYEFVNYPVAIPGVSNIESASASFQGGVVLRELNGYALYIDFGGYIRDGDYFNTARYLTVASTANPVNFRHSMSITDGDGYLSLYYYDNSNRIVGFDVTPDKSRYYLTKYDYDYFGNKTRETDARGNTTYFDYDKLGRLVRKIQPGVAVTEFEYNAIDLITKKIEPDNKITLYTYDTAGRLIFEKTGGSNITTKYFYKQYESYDPSGNLLSYKQGYTVSGDQGRVIDTYIKYEYDNRNRIYRKFDVIENSAMKTTICTYNFDGDKSTEIVYGSSDNNLYGHFTTYYEYDIMRRNTYKITEAYFQDQYLGSIKASYEYDANGNLTKNNYYLTPAACRTTEYAYDYADRVIEIKEPTGEGNAKRVIKYAYDNRDNVTSKTLVYNNQNLTSSYKYNGMGYLEYEINALNKKKRYGYDEVGNKTIETDARFDSSSITSANGYRHTYDALNRLVKTEAYKNGSLETLEQREYDGRGNLAGIKLGNKATASKFVYDAADNVIAYTPAGALEKNPLYVGQEMTYNSLGSILTSKQYITPLESHTTAYQYYGTGMLKSVTYPDSPIPVTYVYDNTGMLYEQKTDRNRGVTKTWKNVFGEPWKTEFPDGTTETIAFDMFLGIAISFEDRKGRKREYAKYNNNNKLLMERYNYGSTTTEKFWKTTKYTYDEWDNLLTTEDFKTVTDIAGTVIKSEASLGNKVTSAYDNAFRIASISDASGHEQLYGYDDADNLSIYRVKTDSNAYDIKRYEYDAIGRLTADIALVPAGQLYDSVNYESDTAYSNMKKLPTTYTYVADKIATRTSPRGYRTAYSYDASLNLLSVAKPHDNMITYTYDFAGQVRTEAVSGGATATFYYSPIGLSTKKTMLSPKGQIMTWEKTYDVMGNLISESTPSLYAIGGKIFHYYNMMNRKTVSTNADGNVLEVYAYDGVGNLLKTVNAKNGAGALGLNFYDGTLGALVPFSGDVCSYDSFDRLVSKTDALQNTTLYEYDLKENLTSVTNARNHSTKYFYNNDSTLNKIEYPDGGQVLYAYDKKGRKTSETVRQSSSVSITHNYSYTPFDTLYTLTDPYLRTIQNYYDGDGNLAKAIDKRGCTTIIAYDGNNRATDKTTPVTGVLNQTTHYEYNAAGLISTESVSGGNAQARTKKYYYANGFLTSMEDNAGRVTHYEYDNYGNRIKTLVSYDSNRYEETSLEYDKYDRLKAIIKLIPAIAIELAGVDSSGADILSRTEYGYDVLGNKISEKMPMAFINGANTAENTTAFYYDAALRLEKSETVYKGATVSTAYTYDGAGNVRTIKDRNNVITAYDYDQMNRVVSTTYAKNRSEEYAVTVKYDLAGNKVEEECASKIWRYEYDLLNRLIMIKDPNLSVTGKYIYDYNGNVIKKIDGRGYLSSNSDNSRFGTVYTYNMANLVETVTDAEGVKYAYEYNCFLEKTEEKDAYDNATVYAYDNAGNMTSVTDPLQKITYYTYDKAGNRIAIVDAKSRITFYQYVSFGLLLMVYNAYDREKVYKYNLTGQKTSMIDRKENKTCYTYNALSLLTNMSVVKAGESAAADSISFDYDPMGNRTGMADSTGTYAYRLDSLGRLLSVSKNAAVQISYTYTLDGLAASIAYGGTTASYTYYNTGKLRTVRCNNQGADYSYDASGNVETITHIGGARQEFTYYKNNATRVITNKSGSSVIISICDYSYDLAGRLTRKGDPSIGISYFSYDACGRLETVAMLGKATSYAYDFIGNRIEMIETYSDPKTFEGDVNMRYVKKVASYEYSPFNELKKMTEMMYGSSGAFVVGKETNYAYDRNGNQYSIMCGLIKPSAASGQPAVSLIDLPDSAASSGHYIDLTLNAFDVWNRLTERTFIKNTRKTITGFSYNGDGLRVSKTVKSSSDNYAAHTTDYIYDGQHVILESDGLSATALYVRGLNYIAKIGVANNVDYYMYNAHGDVVHVTSGNGTIRNRYEYDPFGEAIFNIEETENSIKYAGEFQDSSTGLYYLRARYYDSAIGRFISVDPYWWENAHTASGVNAIKQSANLYAYCMNNPLNYIDPTGHVVSQADKNNLTKAQQAKLIVYTNDYNAAQKAGDIAGMNAAHAKAEAVRNSAGYSGGSDGSGNIPVVNNGNSSSASKTSAASASSGGSAAKAASGSPAGSSSAVSPPPAVSASAISSPSISTAYKASSSSSGSSSSSSSSGSGSINNVINNNTSSASKNASSSSSSGSNKSSSSNSSSSSSSSSSSGSNNANSSINFGPNEGADWMRTGTGKTFEEFWGVGPYGAKLTGKSNSDQTKSKKQKANNSHAENLNANSVIASETCKKDPIVVQTPSGLLIYVGNTTPLEGKIYGNLTDIMQGLVGDIDDSPAEKAGYVSWDKDNKRTGILINGVRVYFSLNGTQEGVTYKAKLLQEKDESKTVNVRGIVNNEISYRIQNGKILVDINDMTNINNNSKSWVDRKYVFETTYNDYTIQYVSGNRDKFWVDNDLALYTLQTELYQINKALYPDALKGQWLINARSLTTCDGLNIFEQPYFIMNDGYDVVQSLMAAQAIGQLMSANNPFLNDGPIVPEDAGVRVSSGGSTNPQDIKPPGWNENWEWRYGTRGDTPRWFDTNGGEWRLHTPDAHHTTTHWDYNAWTDWNSQWQNIPLGGGRN